MPAIHVVSAPSSSLPMQALCGAAVRIIYVRAVDRYAVKGKCVCGACRTVLVEALAKPAGVLSPS